MRNRNRCVHAPECLHIDSGLEHQENMRIIVRVDVVAGVTEVLCTIRAAEPLALDRPYAAVADRR